MASLLLCRRRNWLWLTTTVVSFGCLALDDLQHAAHAREVKGEEAVLESKEPFTLSAAAVAEWLSNVSGGIRTGSRALDTLDVSAHFEGDTFGLTDFSAYADIEQTGGRGFGAQYVGDTQGTSNIDAKDGFTLYEAWINQSFKDQAELKAGIIDLNTEFDVQEVGEIFLNGSFGMGAEFSHSGILGPSSFPTPGLGVRLQFNFDDSFSVKLGVFDGVPRDPEHLHSLNMSLSENDGALLVAELEAKPSDTTQAKLGMWQYTASFPALIQPVSGPGKQLRDSRGLYIETSAHLYREEGSKTKGLDGWLQIGAANSNVNAISGYVGGGLVYTGLLPDRDEDALGIAVASAFYGSPSRHAANLAGQHQVPNETTLELTYVANIMRWLQIQPDIQYVFNPSGDPTANRHAFIVGIEMSAIWSSDKAATDSRRTG